MKISSSSIEMLIASKNITKTELARSCGMCKQNISAVLKRGTCEPRTAGKIASGLGVPVSDIIAKEA